MNDWSIVLDHINLFDARNIVYLKSMQGTSMIMIETWQKIVVSYFIFEINVKEFLPRAFLGMIVISCHLSWPCDEQPSSFGVVCLYHLSVPELEVFVTFRHSFCIFCAFIFPIVYKRWHLSRTLNTPAIWVLIYQ